MSNLRDLQSKGVAISDLRSWGPIEKFPTNPIVGIGSYVLPIYVNEEDNDEDLARFGPSVVKVTKPVSFLYRQAILWDDPSRGETAKIAVILFDKPAKDGTLGFACNVDDVGDAMQRMGQRVIGKEVAKEVPVKSSDGKRFYTVITYMDGSTSCNCPGWTRRGDRTCKHLKFAAKVG